MNWMDTYATRSQSIAACLLSALGTVSASAQDGDCAVLPDCPSIGVAASYISDLRRNLSGGLATGTALSGLLELGAVWKSDGLIPNALVTGQASVIHVGGDALSGDLDLNAEFDVSDTFGFFVGPPFGIGTDLAQTGKNGPAEFPTTSLGLRIAGRIGKSTVRRTAAFDGVPGKVDSTRFVTVGLSRNQGALLIAELELAPEGMSKIALGAWSYTASFDRIDGQATHAVTRTKGNRGAYVMVDAPLGTIGSIEFNRTQLAFDGETPLKSETAFELTYRTQLSSWLALAPALQWVDSPGASRSQRNAWIAGLRFDVSVGHSWQTFASQVAKSD
jgi:Carbohydrate-selective porin, OprB family